MTLKHIPKSVAESILGRSLSDEVFLELTEIIAHPFAVDAAEKQTEALKAWKEVEALRAHIERFRRWPDKEHQPDKWGDCEWCNLNWPCPTEVAKVFHKEGE